MLDTLLTSGSPDFPKFQTKNNAYKNSEQVLGEIIEGALTRRLVSLALINRLAKSAPSLSLSLSLPPPTCQS